MKRVIFVIGKPRSGKDTFGQFLADALGGTRVSTGEHLASMYERVSGVRVTEDNKEEHRTSLMELGDGYCYTDPAALVTDLLEHHGDSQNPVIVTGVRRLGELRAAMDTVTSPLCIWVDRDSGISDNTTVGPDQAHLFVSNKYDTEYLRDTAYVIAKYVKELTK